MLRCSHGTNVAPRRQTLPHGASLPVYARQLPSPILRLALSESRPLTKGEHSDRRRAQPETGTSREGHPHQCEDGPRLPCVFTNGQEPNLPGERNRADTDLYLSGISRSG